MADLRFLCNPVEQFVAWELPGWVKRQGTERAGPVVVEVVHPDREMDGSCRWCGGRNNETVTVEGDRIL